MQVKRLGVALKQRDAAHEKLAELRKQSRGESSFCAVSLLTGIAEAMAENTQLAADIEANTAPNKGGAQPEAAGEEVQRWVVTTLEPSMCSLCQYPGWKRNSVEWLIEMLYFGMC